MKNKPSPATLIKLAAAILIAGGVSATVQATPITGSISFEGTVTMNGGNFLTATAFTSFQGVTVGAPAALSGDYASTSGAAVTMTPFTFNPANASTPIDPLWTFTSGGKTFSFDLSVLNENYASTTGILLSGLGTAHITGEADTTGEWDFSAQSLGVSTFTFSSTGTVPAPASTPDGASTAILLGGTFCCIALLKLKIKA